MTDNVFPFGMLDAYNGNFSTQSTTRRYFGMKGVSDRYNRMLIPQTRRVFFIKQYLPSLLALELKRNYSLSENKTAEYVRKIEAFCSWYSLKKGPEGSVLTKGKDKLSVFLTDFDGVPDAKKLEQSYTKITFSQSCGGSLKELDLITDRTVKKAWLKEKGSEILSLYFENSEKDQIEEALVAWIEKDSERLNKLLREEVLGVLNFNKDVRKELKKKFKDLLNQEIVQWFNKITAEVKLKKLSFERFKNLAAPSSQLPELAEKINSFFVFLQSCKVLADLMEDEVEHSDELDLKEFAGRYEGLIKLTKKRAETFLQKNPEEKKCALAFDITRTDSNVLILRFLMERNERKGQTFDICDNRVLPIRNNYYQKEDSDEGEESPSWGDGQNFNNLEKFILIPQVLSFFQFQLPWSKRNGFNEVREGTAKKEFIGGQ